MKRKNMLSNYLKKVGQLLALLAICFSSKAIAQNSTIQIDPSCQRFIGDVSELDRTKYFSIHDAASDTDAMTFRNDYNVTGGRGFWGPFSYAVNQTGSVGLYPGDQAGNDDVRPVLENFVSTEHPYNVFQNGIDVNSAADWAAEYLKDYVDVSGRNEYFEVMNEPFVHAGDYGSNQENIRLQMAQLYNAVGAKIKNTPALANVKVIGFSSAWPSMELFDFGHWESRMKMFMDTAGDNMHAFAVHLYDGINVTGQDSKRSGSNSEAILDLIENYSFIKWGTIKPHAITEYGAIESGYGPDYSEIASAQTMISINHILLGLLDRQDRIAVSIPFITGKSTWHITEANNYQPYTPALWIPSNIGEPNPTGWVYSPRIHFYELWKDVKGERILIKSDNPDIQTHAFLDGTKMFVVLSNLDDNTQTVDLDMLSGLENVDNVKIKGLKVYPQQMPEMTIETVSSPPSSITLIKDETVVLEYSLNNPITYDNAIRGKNYYTTDYLQTITANSPISYNFNNVDTGTGDGNAILRMGIGRNHDVSKQPTVKVNGTPVNVPDNWKGYDQANRDSFFGVIEIPFPSGLLNENNEITVEFPDTGGRISSMILSTELFDTPRFVLSVLGIGNPCPGQTSGKIIIDPLIPDTYQAVVTGNGVNDTQTFSTILNIENLASGVYNVVVTSTTDATKTFEYTIVIDEPEDLSVFSRVDASARSVSLDLGGGELYRIELNGIISVTDQSEITLGLMPGENTLKVTTNKDCQGKYEESILVYDQVTIFPTIVKDAFTIAFPKQENQNIAYEIISTAGQVMMYKNLANTNQRLNVNIEGLSPGMYFINVYSENINFQSKIIKQ